MADIFQEIDEELRRDRAEAVWARYGNHIIGAALAVLLGIAAYWGWQKYQSHQQTRSAEAFIAAIRADSAKSQELLSAIANGSGNFAALSRVKLAALAVENNDRQKAKGIFAEVSADASLDPAIRGLAALRGAYLELDAGNPSGAQALVDGLKREGDPYRLSALEVTGLAALQSGDKAKAREIFTQIRDLAAGAEGLPMMAERAEQMIDRLAE